MYQLYVSKPKSSWSLRPWILLKELNIPFEDKQVYYLDNLQGQRAQFAQFSPTSKIPVLHHQGSVIWDSLAIVEYIAETYPQVWAEDKKARAWSRSACAEMHSGFTHLRDICNFSPLEKISLPQIPAEVEQELKRINQLWEEGLRLFGGEFLAGQCFTAVDAFFVPVAGRIQTYGLEAYFSTQALAYQQRLLALPSYQEWLNA
ncbi:glutathione S-transferase family protein [Pelistega suis]|uniref:Glutathione S-transferase family protein n=1 Tax=Pelistega suis TaxID=1631957 RepID=A0A849P1K1_9BURK|nr:glutathione S-transferase family protein [Pelistega suis]NOL51589.1 glutathione S-transferase family protein [Pelistega suis]